jgi:hypothetical protein
VIFHPIGRVALAARHGSTPRADDVRGEAVLRRTAAAAGWQLEYIDDSTDRYLARLTLAVRSN